VTRHFRVTFAAGVLCYAYAPTAWAQALSVEEAQVLRDEVASMKARLELLERRLAASEAASPKPTADANPAPVAVAAAPPPAPTKDADRIQWRGSPQFVSGDRRFKVKGRLQVDAGYVSPPPGSKDKAFGFSNEFRRIRLGGEGNLDSRFGYKLELELSDNSVDLVDAFVTYESGPLSLALGNQNQFQSLDELVGDTTGSFMERAAFTDAFNFERRLGLSASYRKGDWLMQAGIFSDDPGSLANDSDGPAGGDENDSFGVDGRLVHVRRFGRTLLHLGASAHWRALNRTAERPTRYGQRPYLHSSNTRVISTPAFAVTNELHYGAEVAAIRDRWHFAAEAHWLRASRPGLADPLFFGGYAELGYFLTRGDSRVYKNGIFDRSAPKSSVTDGGIGSIQLNLRYDYLSLNDDIIRGGSQNALLLGLIWTPVNYLRLNMNYGHIRYQPADLDEFGINVAGLRMELDF
jgi:phosphate-selective porin OprO/OprP